MSSKPIRGGVASRKTGSVNSRMVHLPERFECSNGRAAWSHISLGERDHALWLSTVVITMFDTCPAKQVPGILMIEFEKVADIQTFDVSS